MHFLHIAFFIYFIIFKVPKLRFKEFSGEWEEKKLGDVSNINMGQSPASSSYNNTNNGIYLIQG
jgi:type I restriction enzyme S subunit